MALWTVTLRQVGKNALPGVTVEVEASSRADALRIIQGDYPIRDKWLYKVERKEGQDMPKRTNPTITPPLAPAPEPIQDSKEVFPTKEASQPTLPPAAVPERKGSVGVCVPLSGGVGVIRITSTTKGRDVTKRYLLKCLGSNKFSLTGFVEDGGGYYTVVPGTYCACEDHKRHGGMCKHQNALKSLIVQRKL